MRIASRHESTTDPLQHLEASRPSAAALEADAVQNPSQVPLGYPGQAAEATAAGLHPASAESAFMLGIGTGIVIDGAP